ncbi:MAG: ABC transporter permease [Christensenellales bacterium]|jgi:ribose transport system permease protein|nr:ABC transporter permease [Clostridiales bacterium]
MTTTTTKDRPQRSLSRVLGNYSFVLIFIAILIAYLIINGRATTWNGVMNIFRHSAVVGIMAFGMGLTIITGGIDLSVGSMLALVGGSSVVVFNATNSPIITFFFALFAGFVLGSINGLLIGKVKMPPFIVTLATMMIYRSIAQYYLRSVVRKSIYNMEGTLSSYEPFYNLGQYRVFGVIPLVGIILVIVGIIMVFLTTSTKYGRTIYAVGSNERAALLAGINVDWVRVSVYMITGALCGLSAFVWLAMNGAVDPATLGRSNEMYAIAAVVIGGVSMSGGKGKLLGVLFGALSYNIIDKIIASMGFDALINDTIKGSILLVAVFIQIIIPSLRRRIRKERD